MQIIKTIFCAILGLVTISLLLLITTKNSSSQPIKKEVSSKPAYYETASWSGSKCDNHPTLSYSVCKKGGL